jgi:hypothetical protein
MEENELKELQLKAKERTVKTQQIEYDLETLVKKINKQIIRLDPEYQRRHRWKNDTSSRLIESLILNIPIPVIYLSQDFDVDTETEESRYSVIDGQQRLTAIHNFFKNEFSLEGLSSLVNLNGYFYKYLPPFLIRRLEERTIKCLRIDSTVDSQVKIDIFERLNSGSVRLEPQELRNAVYIGPGNNLCKELSKYENFRILLQIDLKNPDEDSKVQKMEDVELVLRFFSLLNENYTSFKRTKDYSFSNYLSDFVNGLNKLSTEKLKEYSIIFTKTIDIILNTFGKESFAKYILENGEFRKQSKFNSAVFDALMVGIYEAIIKENKNITSVSYEKIKELFGEDQFFDSLTGSYLESSKIAYRINKIKSLF